MLPEFRGRRKYLVENKKFIFIHSHYLDPARDAQDPVQVENTMLYLLFLLHCDEGLATSCQSCQWLCVETHFHEIIDFKALFYNCD